MSSWKWTGPTFTSTLFWKTRPIFRDSLWKETQHIPALGRKGAIRLTGGLICCGANISQWNDFSLFPLEPSGQSIIVVTYHRYRPQITDLVYHLHVSKWRHQQWGSNWRMGFCLSQMQKQKQNKWFQDLRAPCAFDTCLYSGSDCSRCGLLRYLMNHGYFDCRKNPKPPKIIWPPW